MNSPTGTHDASLHPDEDALIRAFFPRDLRRRFLELLAKPKSRRKMLNQFAHFHDLDPRFAHRIPPTDQTVDKIYRLLKQKGASDRCHVMDESVLDGQEVNLREALDALVGRSFGNFVSCIPGKLVYFEGEEPNERYILERRDV